MRMVMHSINVRAFFTSYIPFLPGLIYGNDLLFSAQQGALMLRVHLRIMVPAVAAEKTLSAECPEVLKHQQSLAVGRNDGHIKINQVTVIDRCPLGTADPARIVTGRAGGVLSRNMDVVFTETGVIEDTVSVMTFIAHGIIVGTLKGKVLRCIVLFKEKGIDRPVGSSGAAEVVIVVTIRTVYDA